MISWLCLLIPSDNYFVEFWKQSLKISVPVALILEKAACHTLVCSAKTVLLKLWSAVSGKAEHGADLGLCFSEALPFEITTCV